MRRRRTTVPPTNTASASATSPVMPVMPVMPADTVDGFLGVADELPHGLLEVGVCDFVGPCPGRVGLALVDDAIELDAMAVLAIDVVRPEAVLLPEAVGLPVADGERVRVPVGVGQTGALGLVVPCDDVLVGAGVIAVELVTGRVVGVAVGCLGDVDGDRVGDACGRVGDAGWVVRGCDGCFVGVAFVGVVDGGCGCGLPVDVGPTGGGAFVGSGGIRPGSRPA